MGHSLGGAVAQIAGLEFSYLGYNPSVITWVSPIFKHAGVRIFLNSRESLPNEEEIVTVVSILL